MKQSTQNTQDVANLEGGSSGNWIKIELLAIKKMLDDSNMDTENFSQIQVVQDASKRLEKLANNFN